MKTRMTSFTLEPTLLRKKSNLDGVHPHLATPMGGVNPLQKLEIGNNPHLMSHSHRLNHKPRKKILTLPTICLVDHPQLQPSPQAEAVEVMTDLNVQWVEAIEAVGAEVALMVQTEVVMILQEVVEVMYPEVAVDEARMEAVGVGGLGLPD